jgi:hypothetical protein
MIEASMEALAELTAEEVYERYVKPLSQEKRLRVVALTAAELAGAVGSEPEKSRSILELEGVGADLWKGVDAQEYVNHLRDEWEDRP